MFRILPVIARNQDFTDSYSYYSSSRFKNHRRKVYLVLFEPGGSSDSDGGILVMISQGYDKKWNLEKVSVMVRFSLAFVMPLDR